MTPIPKSFYVLSADPIPLKGCDLWNHRAFMVRITASTKDKRGGQGCGHVKNNTLSVMVRLLDGHVFVRNTDGANLNCPRFQPETMFAFCTVIPKRKNPPPVPSQLFASRAILSIVHLDTSGDRPECAGVQKTPRADCGTGNGSFSTLSSSLPAGWPRMCATTRASFPRLLEFVKLVRQAATAGVHRTADFWQGLRRALGVRRRGPKSSDTDSFHRSS